MKRKFFLDRNSISKIFFSNKVKNVILKGVEKKSLVTYDKTLSSFFFSKTTLVFKEMVGKRIFVHNGKTINSIKVTAQMIGFKLGEFFNNRKSKKEGLKNKNNIKKK